MRFLVWSVGAMVLWLGVETARAQHDGWTWVWVPWSVVWVLLGCGLAVLAAVRAAQGKLGAGVFKGAGTPRVTTPAPHKEE